jgi:hypothetical protein
MQDLEGKGKAMNYILVQIVNFFCDIVDGTYIQSADGVWRQVSPNAVLQILAIAIDARNSGNTVLLSYNDTPSGQVIVSIQTTY